MAVYPLLGTMDNKTSPMLRPGFVQTLCLNGEVRKPGHYQKRRGLATATTIDLTVGTAPFTVKRWINASATQYLVAVGADADAFVNPVNGYLYARTSTTEKIYSDPSTVVTSTWGLATPTTPPVTTRITSNSQLSSGTYAWIATMYDAARRVESPPTDWLATATAGTTLTQMEQLTGPTQAVNISTAMSGLPATGGDYGRLYRSRVMTFPTAATGWNRTPVEKTFSLVQTKAKSGASVPFDDDLGGQPPSSIMTFANAVVPFATASIRFDGRWFYGTGYNVYFSNYDCPETYAGATTFRGVSITPYLGTTPDGLIAGRAEIQLPTEMGTVVGFAAKGDSLLVLCQLGAWRITRLGDGLTYGHSREAFHGGCVSRCTIADSPYGVWWLSRDGINLWDGESAPRLVSVGVLDVDGTDTPFYSTLSSACAAYDVRRNQYVVVVPSGAATQFLLCVQADLPIDNGLAMSKWVVDLDSVVTGMGYDPVYGEIIYTYNSKAVRPTDDVYYDEPTSQNAFTFGVAGWEFSPDVVAHPGVRLTVFREYVAGAQTFAVTARGASLPDIADGSGTSGTLTYAINGRQSQALSPMSVSGQAIYVSLMNTDANAMDMMAIELGESEDMGRRNG